MFIAVLPKRSKYFLISECIQITIPSYSPNAALSDIEATSGSLPFHPPLPVKVDYPIPVLLLATEAFAAALSLCANPVLGTPILRPRVFRSTPRKGEGLSRLTNEREPQPSSCKELAAKSKSSAFQRCLFLET
ncbi:hypothetical protein CEXT_285241 [Caerostris extrusa]|uniref:Uncharacterized protein n=1 Tax=Caerostris extrusa TaxID=172846 RepID=A0AAV4V9H7_CAEEX|nr:hypothetical protein CEXT_285241 [Caerostris extrusa]